jgi:hypothetical protein
MEIRHFLAARLDEEEELARAAKHNTTGVWTYLDPYRDPHPTLERYRLTDSLGYSLLEGFDVNSEPWWTAEHMAHWDPTRVLAEIEAKRAIMAMHEYVDQRRLGRHQFCICQAEDGVLHGSWPCYTLKHMASVYADHADYNPAWAIEVADD